MRKGLFLVTFLTIITTIAFAQMRKVSGTVQGDNGAVIAGASITLLSIPLDLDHRKFRSPTKLIFPSN